MISEKVGEKSKIFTFKVGVAIFMFLFVTILGPGLLNLDSSQALARFKPGCEKIANSAKKACKHDKLNEFHIAIGNCKNISDEDERDDCFRDSEDELDDAIEECKDQKEARIELCEDLEEEFYNPVLDPADFVDPADIGGSVAANPYWPLVPGYMWTYKNRDATDTVTETNTVEVTTDTVMIRGIECVVVHDIVYEGDSTNGEDIIEDTYDWYAQHMDGTVWYLGEFSLAKQECDEETEELCEGLFGDDGSWQDGFNGGRGGIIMFADPSDPLLPGTVYRQELYLGEAEDAAEVVNFDVESVTVPLGGGTTFDTDVLKTYEFSVLEPDVAENKYYAPGVGLLREEALEDDVLTGERVELESINF